jgi:type IV pilus assembly protein PilC
VIVTPAQLKRRAELYAQLGSMLTAGVPLMQALEMVTNDSKLRVSRKVMVTLLEHLKNGLSFGDSMAQVYGWIPEFDIALLSAGEHAGRLDYSFKQLGMYYDTRAAVIRETLGGLWRTAITFHVFLLLFPLGFLFDFILGILNGDYLKCVPFVVERVAAFALLWGTVFLLIFACQGSRGEPWRAIMERISRLVPILGTALQYLALSRLCAALEALVISGVSIVKGWALSSSASGSPSLKKTVAKWKPDLEGGSTPAGLVAETTYFPDMFRNLYHTGEISGKLDDSLGRLHTYYREEGFRLLRVFTKILNGVLYAFVALLVAYNVVHFFIQYYQKMLGNF